MELDAEQIRYIDMMRIAGTTGDIPPAAMKSYFAQIMKTGKLTPDELKEYEGKFQYWPSESERLFAHIRALEHELSLKEIMERSLFTSLTNIHSFTKAEQTKYKFIYDMVNNALKHYERMKCLASGK